MDDSGWQNLLQFVCDPEENSAAPGRLVVAQTEGPYPFVSTPLATPQIPTPPVGPRSILLFTH